MLPQHRQWGSNCLLLLPLLCGLGVAANDTDAITYTQIERCLRLGRVLVDVRKRQDENAAAAEADQQLSDDKQIESRMNVDGRRLTVVTTSC